MQRGNKEEKSTLPKAATPKKLDQINEQAVDSEEKYSIEAYLNGCSFSRVEIPSIAPLKPQLMATTENEGMSPSLMSVSSLYNLSDFLEAVIADNQPLVELILNENPQLALLSASIPCLSTVMTITGLQYAHLERNMPMVRMISGYMEIEQVRLQLDIARRMDAEKNAGESAGYYRQEQRQLQQQKIEQLQLKIQEQQQIFQLLLQLKLQQQQLARQQQQLLLWPQSGVYSSFRFFTPTTIEKDKFKDFVHAIVTNNLPEAERMLKAYPNLAYIGEALTDRHGRSALFVTAYQYALLVNNNSIAMMIVKYLSTREAFMQQNGMEPLKSHYARLSLGMRH